MKETFKKQYKLYLLAILCTMLWGSAIPFIKIGYELFRIAPEATADQLVFAGIRFFGAAVLLTIPLSAGPQRLISREAATQMAVLGLIQTAGQYFFFYIGLSHTSGINASVINSAGTLLCVVLAWIVFRDEKLTARKWIGCIVGFSGILLNAVSTQKMGLLSFRGDGCLILANVCFAVGFLYSKRSVKKTNPFLLTFGQMVIGGCVLLFLGLAMGGELPQITWLGCLVLFYLTVVSAVAFSLWTLLLREYPSAQVGMFHFLTPVFGSLFSCLLNAWGVLNDGSAFTVYTVLAVICAAVGIFLSSGGNKQA